MVLTGIDYTIYSLGVLQLCFFLFYLNRTGTKTEPRALSGFRASSLRKPFWLACSRTSPENTRFPSICSCSTLKSWTTKSRRHRPKTVPTWRVSLLMALAGIAKHAGSPSPCPRYCRIPCPSFWSCPSRRTIYSTSRPIWRPFTRRANVVVHSLRRVTVLTLLLTCVYPRISQRAIGLEEVNSMLLCKYNSKRYFWQIFLHFLAEKYS